MPSGRSPLGQGEMKRKTGPIEKSDILEARRSGVSRPSLAAATGIPYDTIARWERREAPYKSKEEGRPRALSEKQTAQLYSPTPSSLNGLHFLLHLSL